jgi:hypothetical protein
VQNPLASLADDMAHTCRIMALQDGPVVLACHSFAGTVITEAGTDPRVAGLVYIAARAPDAGEDYAALAQKFPTPSANAGLVYSGGFGGLTEDAFLNDFANGVDPVRARVLYAAQGRVSESLFREKLPHQPADQFGDARTPWLQDGPVAAHPHQRLPDTGQVTGRPLRRRQAAGLAGILSRCPPISATSSSLPPRAAM